MLKDAGGFGGEGWSNLWRECKGGSFRHQALVVNTRALSRFEVASGAVIASTKGQWPMAAIS